MKKVTETEQEVSLTLKFKDIFGRPVTSPALREQFADAVVTEIVNRTKSGFGVYDERLRRFPKYSVKYAIQKDVGRTQVDLELSSAMLNAIDLIESSPDLITVGIIGNESPKAHGHQTGQYGVGPLPMRRFMDITQQELSRVKRLFESELKDMTASDALKSQDESPEFTDDDIREAIRLLKKRS